jgi:glycosyltransferase involved in cell wall biosynthesis
VTKLAFVIPAWNRPKHLEICIESIASQVRSDHDVRVIVQDDCSSDTDVPVVCDRMAEKYQCVEIRRRREHGDYSDAFRDMFRAAPDAEWVWTFGDDDKLQPNALKFMLTDVLPRMAERDYFHVAEATRAAGTNAIAYSSRLVDLCGEFGWVDLTGFITGNVCRGPLLASAAETPRWSLYAKSAFVHCAALLETLADRPCAYADIPLISTQGNSDSDETAKRWHESNIPVRYMLMIDCIDRMFDDGILTKKMPAKFFRYLTYHLWDRFLVCFINDAVNSQALWPAEAWGRVERFTKYLADPEVAAKLREDIDAARTLTTLHIAMVQNAASINNQIADIGNRLSAAVYPYSLMDSAEPEKKATAAA